MRQLKHHEQKLLKKVNFLAWRNEHNLRELQVRRLLVLPALFWASCLAQGPA